MVVHDIAHHFHAKGNWMAHLLLQIQMKIMFSCLHHHHSSLFTRQCCMIRPACMNGMSHNNWYHSYGNLYSALPHELFRSASHSASSTHSCMTILPLCISWYISSLRSLKVIFRLSRSIIVNDIWWYAIHEIFLVISEWTGVRGDGSWEDWRIFSILKNLSNLDAGLCNPLVVFM